MSSKTGFVYHERFLEHDTGAGHPERPDALERYRFAFERNFALAEASAHSHR